LTRNLTRERPPCLNENSCLRITPRRTGRCGLQLELPVRAGNSIRLFKVYRHATARSHEAEEAKPAIYGPCGVMACTLGIFLSKSIYLKVAVRICAEPFFFFFFFCCGVLRPGYYPLNGRHAYWAVNSSGTHYECGAVVSRNIVVLAASVLVEAGRGLKLSDYVV
jgi:hypothetical protein